MYIVLIMCLSFICGALYIKLIHLKEKEKKTRNVKKKLTTLSNNIDTNKWMRN